MHKSYLEIDEVYDEKVEVSLFSSPDGIYELYISYGKMYGIIYVEAKRQIQNVKKLKTNLLLLIRVFPPRPLLSRLEIIITYSRQKEPSLGYVYRLAKESRGDSADKRYRCKVEVLEGAGI